MRRTRGRTRIVFLAALAVLAALPAAARASTTQEAIFQDDTVLLHPTADYSRPGGGAAYEQDEARQRGYLLEMKELGADTVHAIVYWGQIAPGNDRAGRPNGAGGRPRDMSNPASYPPQKWDLLDSLVRQTREIGLGLILSPAGAAVGSNRIKVPLWARQGKPPNPKDYGNFVKALGRRYSGTYRDEDGGGILPRVSRWGVWNEPNIGGWIQPQWKLEGGKRIARSPVIYRDLYRAAYSALATSGHRRDQILLGEFAPLGRNRKTATSPIAPGKFLREMLCLDDRLHPYRGAAAKARDCKGRFRRIVTSGIAHHVYTEGRGQPATFKGARDIFPVGNIAGLETLVSRLSKTGRISRVTQFLNTEFGFQSNPPDSFSGVSLNDQGTQENIAEYLEYKRPRWTSFTHYLMVDDPCGRVRCGGFQTGLKFLDLTEKPAYDAYRMPIVVRASGSEVSVWGANRPGGAGSSVEILVNGASVQTVSITNPRGYFDVKLASGGAGATYQLRDPNTGFTSRLATVTPGLR